MVNGGTAYLLMKGKNSDINIKAAYLHAATDMLVSVGVVLSGIVIQMTDIYMIDPVISLLITIIVAVPATKLVVESVKSIKRPVFVKWTR